jgi:ketosteroid isomerase-like protein
VEHLETGQLRADGRHNGSGAAGGNRIADSGCPSASISERDLGSWLAAYGRAWEGRDPVAVASLFTDDASYAITPSPFDEPLRGREEILDYWAGATAADKRVSFDYEVLAVADERGIARWWASMQERDGHVRIGGVFVVALTSDNRCSELREWWNGDDEERSGPPRLDVSPATRRPR